MKKINEHGHLSIKSKKRIRNTLIAMMVVGFLLAGIPLITTVMDVLNRMNEVSDEREEFSNNTPKYHAILETGEIVEARNCSSNDGITTCDIKVYPEELSYITEEYVVSSYELQAEEDMTK